MVVSGRDVVVVQSLRAGGRGKSLSGQEPYEGHVGKTKDLPFGICYLYLLFITKEHTHCIVWQNAAYKRAASINR